ncbi:MAG: CAAX prenyl protease-related protein [Candidatus Woesearchaeota archaeon]
MTYVYFLVLFIYLATGFIDNLTISLTLKFLIGFISLFYFREYYKFKMKFDFFAIFIGLLVAFVWIFGLKFYDFFNLSILTNMQINFSMIDLILKFITFTIFTPVIEEFFMRFWLIRFIISKDWKKVEIGKFTFSSFLFTTLFFGFSHTLWIQGIVAGILFNLVYYYRKNIESCILAHFVSNFFLAVVVLLNGNIILW